MVRNIILASLISTFSFFGALGSKDTQTTLTCLGIGILAWVLCVWRCIVLNQRIAERRQGQRLFNEYMRSSAFNRRF